MHLLTVPYPSQLYNVINYHTLAIPFSVGRQTQAFKCNQHALHMHSTCSHVLASVLLSPSHFAIRKKAREKTNTHTHIHTLQTHTHTHTHTHIHTHTHTTHTHTHTTHTHIPICSPPSSSWRTRVVTATANLWP